MAVLTTVQEDNNPHKAIHWGAWTFTVTPTGRIRRDAGCGGVWMGPVGA